MADDTSGVGGDEGPEEVDLLDAPPRRQKPGRPRGAKGAKPDSRDAAGAEGRRNATRIETVGNVIETVLNPARKLGRTESYDIQTALSGASPGELSTAYKAFATELLNAPSEEQRRSLAARIRTALRAWDAMVICADLAAVRQGSRHPIEDRMRAITEEPFFWDARIKFIELSLYKRSKDASGEAEVSVPDGSATQETRARVGRAGKKLTLQHCFAVRLPKDPEMRAAMPVDEDGKYGPKYRDLLRQYMLDEGSSIDLDGHITRDPRFAAKDAAGGTRDDEVDFDAEVYVSEVDSAFEVIARDGKLGSDEKFIENVVEKAFGFHIEKEPILHFMEGIDKNFSASGEREGITAHMFLVYEHPKDVQRDSDLARNIQLLLLRFCAYYMDDEASKKEQLAKEEGARANKVAIAAQRARESLRSKARSVQDQITTLTALANDMEASMQENPDVSRFILWLNDIVPLFKTGEPFPLPGVSVDVRGNHNSWTHDHLAAALWAYTRLEPPAHLRDNSRMSLSDLWNASIQNLDDDEVQARMERMIVRRQGVFQSMRRVKELDVQDAFKVMKRWNAKAKDLFRASGTKSEFFFSQLLFLLGNRSFLRVEDKNDKRFEFVSQTMVEGLIHFANNIDRGLHDDRMRDTLKLFGVEPEIVGGLINVAIDVSGEEDDRDEEKDAIDQPNFYLGPEHLIVRLWQHDVLSARGATTRAEAAARAGKNLADLLEKVAAKEAPLPGESSASQMAHREWRDNWNKGGREETSYSLGKALGLSETYQVAAAEGEDEPFFAQVGASEHWMRTYIDVPSGGRLDTTIAMLRCDPEKNMFEFRFRRKSPEDKFSAMK
ncbi:MAG: hypothetical protein AB7G40_17910 [Hyphomonadaceae bacterium]